MLRSVLFASWLGVFLCFTSLHCVYADRINDLHQQFKESSVNNYKPILEEISQLSDKKNITEAYNIHLKNIQLSDKKPFKNAAIHSRLFLAKFYFKYDSVEKSVSLAKEAYQLAKEQKLVELAVESCEYIVMLYSFSNNNLQTLNYALEAQSLYAQLGTQQKSLSMYHNIATIYYRIKDYDNCIFFLNKVLGQDYSKMTPRSQINIFNTMGLAHRKKKAYDKAIEYFNTGVNIAKVHKDTIWIGILTGNIGDVYVDEGLYTLARMNLKKDIDISMRMKEYSNAAISIMRLGECAMGEHKYNEALSILEEALTVLKKDSAFYARSNQEKNLLYNNLALTCEKLKLYEKALFYQKEAFRYLDSLNQENKEVETKKALLKFEFSSKVNLINQENKIKAKAQKTVLTLIVTATFLLSVLLVILFLLLRKQRKLNQQVQQQNQIIAKHNQDLNQEVIARTLEINEKNETLLEINKQLEGFTYIIAHNLRSPVASMLGLSSIFDKERFDTAENRYIVEKLFESAEKLDITIKDLNLILKVRKNIDEIIEPVSLMTQAQKAIDALQQEIELHKVIININLGDTQIMGVSAYMESIFYNLISNAIKYRHPKRAPKIVVSSPLTQGKQQTIIIQDNGLGMSLVSGTDKIFGLYKRLANATHIEGKGIGLYLVKTQVQAMKGFIEVESQIEEGTTFIIQLPKIMPD